MVRKISKLSQLGLKPHAFQLLLGFYGSACFLVTILNWCFLMTVKHNFVTVLLLSYQSDLIFRQIRYHLC